MCRNIKLSNIHVHSSANDSEIILKPVENIKQSLTLRNGEDVSGYSVNTVHQRLSLYIVQEEDTDLDPTHNESFMRCATRTRRAATPEQRTRAEHGGGVTPSL